MPRPDKVQAVADIKERIENARAVFLAEYAGLSVHDQQVLRRSLRKGGAEFKVVKMTLARRAAADLDIDSLEALLTGPTGLAFADEDAVSAAKALRDFAKEHEVFSIKGGLLGADFLTPERIDELADIESRDVLLAKILGAMQAPMANLAGLLSALPRGLATSMQQLMAKLPEEPTDSEAQEPEAAVADEAPEAAVDEESEAAVDEAPEAAVDEEPEAAVDEEPEAAVDEEPEPASDEPEEAGTPEPEDTQEETDEEEAAEKAEEE